LRRWSRNPRIEVLGSPDARRLSIVSLRIRHGDRYLHHNYIVAVLNDLFGIQARGGCSCAGPYGHRLLEIDTARSDAFRDEIGRGCGASSPGGPGSTSITSSLTSSPTTSSTRQS